MCERDSERLRARVRERERECVGECDGERAGTRYREVPVVWCNFSFENRQTDVSLSRSVSHRSEDAMSQPSFPAPVTQFVVSTTRLCALFLCRERPPLVYQMVLRIDAPEQLSIHYLAILKSRESTSLWHLECD